MTAPESGLQIGYQIAEVVGARVPSRRVRRRKR